MFQGGETALQADCGEFDSRRFHQISLYPSVNISLALNDQIIRSHKEIFMMKVIKKIWDLFRESYRKTIESRYLLNK